METIKAEEKQILEDNDTIEKDYDSNHDEEEEEDDDSNEEEEKNKENEEGNEKEGKKQRKRKKDRIITSLMKIDDKNVFHELEKRSYINNTKMSLSNLHHIIPYPLKTNIHELTTKPPECYSIQFSKSSHPSSPSFSIGYSNGEISIINNLTNLLQIKQYHDPISSLRYHPTKPSTLLAITSKGDVIHLHSLSGRTLSKFTIPNEALRASDYDSKGDNFAITLASGEVRLYNEDMQMLEHTFKTGTSFAKGHVDQVHSVVFIPNEPNAIISGGRDKRVVLWDKRSNSAAAMIVGPMIMGDAIDVKNNMLLTGSYDIEEGVKIWDLRTRKVMKEYKMNSMVYCCKFNHSDKSNSNLFAVGGYKKNDIKVYNTIKGLDYISGINAFTFPIYALDFSSDGKNLLYGCEDGGARIVDL